MQSNDPQRLVRLVTETHYMIGRLFSERANEQGLKSAEWRVLVGLYRNDGFTQTQLASAIAMAKSPLGKVVDKLEAKNLIERRGDPEDRRVYRLHLTREALRLIKPEMKFLDEVEENAMADLPNAESEMLIRSLKKVYTALKREIESVKAGD